MSCQRRSDTGNFSFSLFPSFLFDRFPDTGNGLDSVSRIESRRIDEIPEPRTIAKSVRIDQQPLRLYEFLIDLSERFCRNGTGW